MTRVAVAFAALSDAVMAMAILAVANGVFAFPVFADANSAADAAAVAASGIDAYKSGDMPAALTNLTLSSQLLPARADLHYWRGLTLTRMKKYGDALAEFKTTIKLDSRGSVGKLAQQALLGIKDVAFAQVSSEKTGESNASGSTSKDVVADRKWLAIQHIRSQGQLEKDRAKMNWEQVAKTLENSRSLHVNDLINRKNRDVTAMRNSRTRDAYGNSVPVYSESEIQAVAAEYDKRIKALEKAFDDETADAQLQIGKSHTMIDGVLSGLESQINSKSGITLVPDGTNFYVRNYGLNVSKKTFSMFEQEDELVADQDLLILEPRHRGDSLWKSRVVPAELAADQAEMSFQQRGQQRRNNELLKVRGHVMPKRISSQ